MRQFLIVALCCVVLAVGGLWFVSRQNRPPATEPVEEPASPPESTTSVPPEKVIDYGAIKEESDQALTDLMKERKEPYGLEKGVDMVVKSDESIKVGEETVKMKDIADEVRLKQGEILEVDLKSGTGKHGPDEYGIYVVQPNDNIWDIHFRLLKEYYDHKGIQLSPAADEPDSGGRSSGVGKILKFSEQMVYIYNLKEHKLDTGLDLIYPLSKIVIYNMGEVFALLDRINYKDISRIAFDGQTLWLPAEQ
jgi:predicted RNA-binding protein